MSQYNKLREAISKIYGKPASVTVMRGKWKTGKTNTALYFAQLLKSWGIVSEIASNIEVYESLETRKIAEEQVKFVSNFLKLRMWGFATNRRKLYIFDEAIKNAPSRSAMTKLNKAWLEVIPEASKMRLHILAITQTDEYIESIFKNEAFLNAVWEKTEQPTTSPLYRKVVTLKAKEYYSEVLEFYPIPQTTLIYDPYLSANMSLEPQTDSLNHLPLEVRIALDFGEGLTTEDIKTKYELPTRKQAVREVRKGLAMIKSSCLVSDSKQWVVPQGQQTPTAQHA